MSLLTLSDEKKADLLLASLDSETFERLKIHVSPQSLSDIKFGQIKESLIHIYDRPVNHRTERFHLHTLVQESGQTVSEYIHILKTQANKCKYGDFIEEAMIDQLIFGVRDVNIRKKLLARDKLDYDKPTFMAIQDELIERDSATLSYNLNKVEYTSSSSI